MRLRFYMYVQNHHDRWVGSNSELWTRVLTVPVAPLKNERVEIWPEGPLVQVKERWFDNTGQPHCDLRTAVIDPDPDEERYQSHDTNPRSWSWLSTDGALRSKLLEGGWTTRESQ